MALPDSCSESGSATCISTIIVLFCFAVADAKEHTDPRRCFMALTAAAFDRVLIGTTEQDL